MSDTLPNPARLAGAHQSLFDTIKNSHPSLIDGKVFCPKCSRTRVVDAARCLPEGWPKCCGGTMSLGKPEAS